MVLEKRTGRTLPKMGRNPARILDVWAIRDLEMEMGFVSITREPDLPENLAALDVVALLHADTAIHEVRVRRVFTVLVCDDHLVSARAVRTCKDFDEDFFNGRRSLSGGGYGCRQRQQRCE